MNVTRGREAAFFYSNYRIRVPKFLYGTLLSAYKESMDALIKLLNKDTLKTMQLIGFNYKEAIGQPLTDVCSEAITGRLGPKKNIRK